MIDPRAPDYSHTPAAPSRPRPGYQPASTSVAPCVSIVTPVYEPGPELLETAMTVFAQSLQQWEWIIVDDGSTSEQSASYIKTCVDSDDRVRPVRLHANSGLSAARNAGIATAKGAFVTLLDGDDLLEPTALEKWWWFLETSPELAFCKGYSLGFGDECYLWSNGFHDGAAFLDANLVDVTSMIRSRVFRRVGGFEEGNRSGLEDWEFWLRCADAGLWGGTVPEYLNWYRRRAGDTRWSNLTDEGRATFRTALQHRFPRLWTHGFPVPRRGDSVADTSALVGRNRLTSHSPRLLLVEGALAGGAEDLWNRLLLESLTADGWQVTVVVTSDADCEEAPAFAAITPDVLIAPHFVHPADVPVFLDYLINSRQFDAVCVARSDLGQRLLPDLASRFPNVAWFTIEADVSGDLADRTTPVRPPSPESGERGLEERLHAAFGATDSRTLRRRRIETPQPFDTEARLRAVVEALHDDGTRRDLKRIVDRAVLETRIRELEMRLPSESLAIEATPQPSEPEPTALVDAGPEARIVELEAWSAEQQTAIDWLNTERAKLTALLEESAAAIADREGQIAELRKWAAEQQTAIDWLNSERKRLAGNATSDHELPPPSCDDTDIASS